MRHGKSKMREEKGEMRVDVCLMSGFLTVNVIQFQAMRTTLAST